MGHWFCANWFQDKASVHPLYFDIFLLLFAHQICLLLNKRSELAYDGADWEAQLIFSFVTNCDCKYIFLYKTKCVQACIYVMAWGFG